MLRAPLGLDGRPFDLAGPRPRFYSDWSSEFVLNDLPSSRNSLVVSGFASSHPLALATVGDALFWSRRIGSCGSASCPTAESAQSAATEPLGTCTSRRATCLRRE